MIDLTREQELALVAALENNGVFRRIEIIAGLGLIHLGVAKEVQNTDRDGKKLPGWCARLELTGSGAIAARSLKERDLALARLSELQAERDQLATRVDDEKWDLLP